MTSIPAVCVCRRELTENGTVYGNAEAVALGGSRGCKCAQVLRWLVTVHGALSGPFMGEVGYSGRLLGPGQWKTTAVAGCVECELCDIHLLVAGGGQPIYHCSCR